MSEVRALLLTDVVDSTALLEELGDERMAALWAAHDEVSRELLGQHAMAKRAGPNPESVWQRQVRSAREALERA